MGLQPSYAGLNFVFGCLQRGQFVLVECFVHVGDVTVKHVEQTVHLYYDDAVALGVALGLDEVDAVGYLLTSFICFYAVNLYAFGVIPVRDLNRREKCCGYSKPSW